MTTASRSAATSSPSPVVAVAVALVALLLIGLAARNVTDQNGAFTYSIDDAYIHLAMAEQFADDLTWGLRPGEVESASSSPGYTAVLAAATFLPVDNQWLPLLLNGAAAAFLVLLVIRASGATSPVHQAVVGVTSIFALALVPSAMWGMEVLPHAAVAALFVLVLARHVSGARVRPPWVLALLAGALVTLRLESAFMLAGAGLALVLTGTGPLRSRLRDPIAIAAGGLLTLGALVALHLAGGQFPLPTSVVAKSRVVEDGDNALLRPLQDPVGAIEILGRNLNSNARLMWAVTACLVVLVVAGGRARGERPADGARTARTGLQVTAITVLVAFVGQSWYGYTFTRYGEWLVVCGVVVAALATAALLPHRAVLTWTAAALALALGQVNAGETITDSASSLHRQQEQMGRFLAEYYPTTGAGVNDLGMVGWLHEGPLVDFLGLGSVDITRSRRENGGTLTVEEMERIAEENGVEVVVIYAAPRTFFPELPDSWEPVRDWCLEGSTGVAADRCVTWFATQEGDPEQLEDDLVQYEEERMPPGVSAQESEFEGS